MKKVWVLVEHSMSEDGSTSMEVECVCSTKEEAYAQKNYYSEQSYRTEDYLTWSVHETELI